MSGQAHPAAGREYLDLVTDLLQQLRRAESTGGVWEAADLQWWWRRDQHPDPAGQIFWLEDGRPRAASVLTRWPGRWGLDLLGARRELEPYAWEQLSRVGDEPVEMVVRDDDPAGRHLAEDWGFTATEEVAVETWLAAAERPEAARFPAGFGLRARSETSPAGSTHPMARRNGADVEARLLECSLYQPALDLAVHGPKGEVAGYGLFWADPVTGVGLVEPMRTEEEFQGRGIGHALLRAGIERLARRGCSRFKVTYLVGNEASRRLYLGAGFRPGVPSRTFRRQPAEPASP